MSNNIRAINYLDKHRHLVQNLAQRGASQSLFSTIRDLLCFASLLGYSRNNKSPLGNEAKAPSVEIQQFESTNADDYIYMIAAAEHNDIDVLREGRTEDIIETFEEYVNGGLDIIQSWLDDYNDPLGFEAIIKGLESDNLIALETNAEKISIDF